MIFEEGTEVTYKSISGVIAFTSEQYVSILVSKGKHRAQDVRVVVYHSDFTNIVFADGK
jgi:prepilin-type processing-associated H-X9-DG protein